MTLIDPFDVIELPQLLETGPQVDVTPLQQDEYKYILVWMNLEVMENFYAATLAEAKERQRSLTEDLGVTTKLYLNVNNTEN